MSMESARLLLSSLTNNPSYTEAEANAYLEIGQPLFRPNMEWIRRQRDVDQLTYIYTGVCVVAGSANEDVFAQAVPSSELQAFVVHMTNVFVEWRLDERSLRTGAIMAYDLMLLDAFPALMRHDTFVKMVMKKSCKLLSALSDWLTAFLEAHDTIYVPPKFGAVVVGIVYNGLECWMSTFRGGTLTRTNIEEQYERSVDMKRLESSGVLQHFLRFAIQPHDDDERIRCQSVVLDALIQCPTLVQKKFRSDSATGKTLRTLITQRRQRPEPSLLLRLQHLVLLSDMANPIKVLSSKDDVVSIEEDADHVQAMRLLQFCRNCNTAKKKLLLCGRCKSKF